jgi:Fe-S cluster assembly protein SufD
MKDNNTQTMLKDRLLRLYKDNQSALFADNVISDQRAKAITFFEEKGFPNKFEESWRGTDLTTSISKEYELSLDPPGPDVDIEKLFTCEIHDFDTDILSLLNGWVVDGASKLKVLDNGCIIGSLNDAMKSYPQYFKEYYGSSEDIEEHSLSALNTAFAIDGIFIYVPDNVVVEKALQMVSILNHKSELFVQNRNLIILGKNSKLSLVQCDDTTNHLASFNNSVTEIFVGDGGKLDHYKMQNLNNDSTLVNATYIKQGANSNVSTNAISLNGGLIRNNTFVRLAGQGSHADILGIYLMDRKQHVDNQVFVDHQVPNCTSNEMFKGILDEEASGVFKGHILVRQDAQNTNAFQNNKNILLTDTASIDSKPFLEIYADDVKCSHGATVGQLDEDAMFYLRQRGITESNARMLLMYAFAAEVSNKITIDALRDRIDDMIKKRLRGELSICDTCVLHCGKPEMDIEFDIDLSKI